MAIAIREIPILTGQSAEDFLAEAEKWDQMPVPHLTEEQETRLRQIKESGRNFVW